MPPTKLAVALLLAASAAAVAPDDAGSRATLRVVVRNDLDLPRAAETVALDAALLRSLAQGDELRRVHVSETPSGQELLTQVLDDDGDGRPDRLAFQADFAARAARTFQLALGTPQAYRREDFKVYGRFVRERFDDFAWENDRVAQRTYGAALESWTREPLTSSAIDVWLKRTRRLVVNDWYMTDDYHRDTGEGADLYSAGSSRGCGGSGLWRDGRLVVSKNFRDSRVLASGPLRLLFELQYPAWDLAAVRSERKRVSLDAGHNLSRYESRYEVAGGGPLSYAVGIKKQAGASLRVERARGWLRTWEPVKDGGGSFGCGILLDPATIVDVTEDERNHLLVARVPAGQPAVHHAGFGWDRSGDFASVADWDRYLDEWAQRLRSPLRVEPQVR